MLVQNSSEKCAKKLFLYSHEYRDQKMRGKKPAKFFFQKHTNCASKKYWERSSERSAKNVFHNHTYIMTKKWRGKNRETIFTEVHE